MHDHPLQSVVLGFIVHSTVDPLEAPLWLYDGREVLLTAAGDYELVSSC